MLQIPRSDLASEEGSHIDRLLAEVNVDYWAGVEIIDPTDVLIRIEARVPDSETIAYEALFRPESIPTIMLTLYQQHEVTRALAEFHNRVIDYYMAVVQKVTRVVINARSI